MTALASIAPSIAPAPSTASPLTLTTADALKLSALLEESQLADPSDHLRALAAVVDGFIAFHPSPSSVFSIDITETMWSALCATIGGWLMDQDREIDEVHRHTSPSDQEAITALLREV